METVKEHRPARRSGGTSATARPEDSRAPQQERLAREALRQVALDSRIERWAAQGLLPYPLLAGEWGPTLAAIGLALHPEDWLFPALREARAALVRGMPVEAYLAQALGLSIFNGAALPTLPGAISDVSHRVASVAGGSGAHLPHAVGAAMAARLRKVAEVALALCGEAAVASPDFHVACNFAGVFRAPALVCVRLEAGSTFDVEARAAAYGLTAARLDCSEPERLHAELSAIVERTRGGGGAALLALTSPGPAEAVARGLCQRLGLDWKAELGRLDQLLDVAFEAARAGGRAAADALTANVFASPEQHLEAEQRELSVEPAPIPDDV
ncbi:MAG: thiamine pyrophosphate-dependent enzyme [Deltaproteobacteria bacterium]